MNDFAQIVSGLGDAARAIGAEVASVWVLIQLALLLLAAAAAAMIGALVRKRADLVALTMGWPAFLRLFARAIAANIGMIAFVAIVALMQVGMLALAPQAGGSLLGAAEKLGAAWVVINLIAGLVRNRLIFRVLAVSAWTIAALSILGLLGPVGDALDSVAVSIGGLRVSPLLVLKTAALLVLAVWAASALSNFLERRVHGASDLTPSFQVLIGKLARLTLMTLAILIVVRSTGIDLSALAIFTGALGVGVGFGLQKIVSNFVSGIILLVDKSIKPGDVITVGESYGWVNAMNTRCIAVITRDGREVLIPNEDLVTQRVVNWSYTKEEIRLDVPFGVEARAEKSRAGLPFRGLRLEVAGFHAAVLDRRPHRGSDERARLRPVGAMGRVQARGDRDSLADPRCPPGRSGPRRGRPRRSIDRPARPARMMATR